MTEPEMFRHVPPASAETPNEVRLVVRAREQLQTLLTKELVVETNPDDLDFQLVFHVLRDRCFKIPHKPGKLPSAQVKCNQKALAIPSNFAILPGYDET